MDYSILEKMKPSDYLSPDNFKTNYDKDDEHAKKQYRDGLKLGSEMGYIFITDRSIWLAGNSATTGVISSSEGIGYHKNTAPLLKGFLDSGAEIQVSRFDDEKGFSKHIIQKGDNEVINNIQLDIKERIEKNNLESKVFCLEPLNGRPLNSQIVHDLELPITYGDLVYDKDTYSYSGKKNNEHFIFILSNFDIANQNMTDRIKEIKNDNIVIEKNASVNIFRKGTKDHFSKFNSETIKIDNKKLTIYPQPKSHHQDQQMVYAEIVRENPSNTRKTKRVNKP